VHDAEVTTNCLRGRLPTQLCKAWHVQGKYCCSRSCNSQARATTG
jgi:hypothetical protein